MLENHINRIMLERQFGDIDSQKNSQYIGEITNETFGRPDMMDKGMPLRSSFSIRKPKFDINSHLDFDLHKSLEVSQEKIAYSDQFSGEYANLNEAMKTITKSVDPMEQYITDINVLTFKLSKKLWDSSHNGYVINGISLFSGFAGMYMECTGNLEFELKSYFGYNDKRALIATTKTLQQIINGNPKSIKYTTMIVNNPNITTSQALQKYKTFFTHITLDNNDTLNKTIKNVIGIERLISPATEQSINISLMTICCIRPTWGYQIDAVKTIKMHDNIIQTIQYIGKSFNYYEDTEIQLIEIPFDKNDIVFGIILSKNPQKIEHNDITKLIHCINYLRMTSLDEVVFPIINKRYKTRLTSILKTTGLNSTFVEDGLDVFFPDGGHLTDCIQYVDILLTTNCGKQTPKNLGNRTMRKFIASSEFEFYIRHIQMNMIMLVGRF